MTFQRWFPSSLDLELSPKGSAVPPDRLISGSPMASSLQIHEESGTSCGLWEVTPGEFVSVKNDTVEIMHFLSGEGVIEHPDGQETEITPGAVVRVGPNWRGVWRVRRTARKFYVAYTTSHTQSTEEKE